ncbi:osmC-like family protein [Candidatus Phytoplasma oryzae]|uniref:OsmC-like family protein n=1 Tax=Candidatus Phytoplasma oryzae TaxID=203274 RepID=A0A139JR50_9MOLU|nr:OsmC family protein [Candidatus Phytoplasma oryzae]KXT29314.1 osmC-like family protein [Candidatus Phytoplasma oryzae]RAM57869.1 hypothetical protein DH96_00935 [Candidatus Phytoplasma oryzae]
MQKNSQSLLNFTLYFEEQINDLLIIKDGLKTKVTTFLVNEKGNYSSPRELFCLSLGICFYKTVQKYLSSQKKIFSDIKVKIVCETYRDDAGFYFNINLFLGIKDISLTEIEKIIHFADQRCPISKMLINYKYIKLIPCLFNEL